MSEFKVCMQDLSNATSEYERLAGILSQASQNVRSVKQNLRLKVAQRERINSRLNSSASLLSEYQNTLSSFHKTAEQVIALYQANEEKCANVKRPQISNNGPYSIDSILFDDDGSYGGNQGSMDETYKWDPQKCWELLHYLREYFPNMSVIEAFQYFSQLNHVGCGYVALANTIFLEYEGRPSEFERIFGYPMFKDGDLNYDRLILDIYATTDKAGINDGNNGLPEGVTEADLAEIIGYFLADKSVGVRTELNAEVTSNNFRQIVEEGGHVILGYRHGNMYDEKGKAHFIDGGHAITVTGITDDGRYVVSSWGEKYYINASDLDDNDIFMVYHYDS